MKFKPKQILSLVFTFVSFTVFGQKELQYDNAVYEPGIKTVQINIKGGSVENAIAPPVTRKGQKSLILSFDELNEDADYYYVYFIHCNADWTPSSVRPNMYLNAYNEFEIEQFEFSAEAKRQYVNYRFEIPAFKMSGNYLAVVYRDRNKEDLVLSQRFYVFEESASAGLSIVRSADQAQRLTNQRVEVTLNYGNLKAVDPREQFTTVVRQNQRPDLTHYNLSPTFIDENSKMIRFQNLDELNEFPGTNEFRSFDLGIVTFTGRNVQDILIGGNEVKAQLRLDRPLGQNYLQALDINGQFYIRDLESRPGQTTAEYIDTQFKLDYPETDQSIYVIGSFNQWQRNENSRLRFNPATGFYETNILVKQGWYNYAYVLSGNDPYAIDGNFWDTENLYEVFVYFRPMGARGDLLVAYGQVPYNSRR